METIKLADVSLSTEMITAVDVTPNFEISGHIVIGQSNLVKSDTVGSSILGENNIINKNYSGASGKDNVIGIAGYKIINVQDVVEINSTLSSAHFIIENEPSHELSASNIKASSTDFSTSLIGFADVISVDYANKKIAVNVLKSGCIRTPLDVKGKTIFFQKDGSIVNIGDYFTDGNYSHAEGLENIVAASYSHVEGKLCQTTGTYGHAEGKRTSAGWGGHAQGCGTRALAVCSHASGRGSYVSNGGQQGTATGSAARVDGNSGTAAGFMAYAKDDRSYVWSGTIPYGTPNDPNKQYDSSVGNWKLNDTTIDDADLASQEFMDHATTVSSMYTSHGAGSFNINPSRPGSLNYRERPEYCEENVYIGQRPLDKILSKYDSAVQISKIVSQQLSTSEEYMEIDPYVQRPSRRVRKTDGVEENGGSGNALAEYYVNSGETYKVTAYLVGAAGICFYNSSNRQKMVSSFTNATSQLTDAEITIPTGCDIVKVSTTDYGTKGFPVLKRKLVSMKDIAKTSTISNFLSGYEISSSDLDSIPKIASVLGYIIEKFGGTYNA